MALLSAIVFGLAGIAPVRFQRTIPFPRKVLARFLVDETTAKPGTRIDSPTFEAGGSRWQLNLYPLGGNADPYFAGRVGLYLRLLQPEMERIEGKSTK